MINGNEVTFDNGDRENFDVIIFCTGYKIDLDYFQSDLRKILFKDKNDSIEDADNLIKIYRKGKCRHRMRRKKGVQNKNVFVYLCK